MSEWPYKFYLALEKHVFCLNHVVENRIANAEWIHYIDVSDRNKPAF